MHRLNARHWGLAAIIAVAPFVLAFVLGASAPQLLEPVLGTPVGGLSWGLAAVLGLVGGALFARILAALQRPRIQASPVLRVLGTVGGASAVVTLCIVPAVALMLLGPGWVLHQHLQVPAAPTVRSLEATAVDLLGQARRANPHRLPLSLLLPGPH
ncbi:hypothetical protein HRD49_33075 [Corallococcus exiguus]|uniref:Uncharacterized protein n=1 Tax=Corallococcus exiguus TaxID=83462 RepID=A0A7Y1WXV3_9BACT|nr:MULTISPECIES: hypothetical protein [Corallococcus]NBC43550.1 hypothetical protein [Corallococcus exiguus]NNC18920.1 hypothetical protein [Corallococcus exiguus]NRD56265.1 hypothetical protein [Corallococcus exiguus]NRD66594.1 hypothetical protein [Corallococcus exiguus]RKH25045.1 hypothetical protein D7V77_18930 [Corallococcus sp. CA041A]